MIVYTRRQASQALLELAQIENYPIRYVISLWHITASTWYHMQFASRCWGKINVNRLRIDIGLKKACCRVHRSVIVREARSMICVNFYDQALRHLLLFIRQAD